MDTTHDHILDFWFDELSADQWFHGGDELDLKISNRFRSIHQRASHGELITWRETPMGQLAEIIILDQFSRNIYRNLPQAFAQDGLALDLAQKAVAAKADLDLPLIQKKFLYMPYMHSESLAIHNEAVKLFASPGMELTLDYEFKHQEIIKRFGRYPHRNIILGRQSTPEEINFLKESDSSF